MAHKSPLIPFYAVVDVSFSMTGDKIDAANRILPEVSKALAMNPTVNDKVRFGLIDFADNAKSVVPLCDMSTFVGPLPTLVVRGGTNYGEAFTFLRHQIETDVAQLQADGYKVHRPAVFFLSDGEPTDQGWQTAFDALTQGFKGHPIMVPFGVEDADKSIMDSLVSPPGKSRSYMMADGVDAAQAIRAVAEILVASALSSGASGQLMLPAVAEVGDGQLTTTGPQGVIHVDDDYLD